MNDDLEYGNKENVNWNNINSYSLSNSDYTAVIKDSYRNLYYRIVYLRPSLEDVKKGKRVPDFSVIVINENLDIIVEKKFNSTIYSHTIIIPNEKGLAIARKDLYNLNDNKLTFSFFNIKK
ncbi:DUF4221 family protein [Tenacibaculum tangerinum]|uniref:DUF4221 family protein n=1 Tax=Tenacibaculum tangerinum TaxID=3038772 RepID=A0ABY8L198_9FLAO|nr:DUF4221 family protein [Tenacibaculum tangerinum]WGH74118.1 DUF4221 family protein [Tenacibaculum tangerinum]